jgi:hypothetical protein
VSVTCKSCPAGKDKEAEAGFVVNGKFYTLTQIIRALMLESGVSVETMELAKSVDS